MCVRGHQLSTETSESDREHLLTQSTTAAHNETNHLDVELAPTMVGEDVRVTFMLFVGDESQVRTIQRLMMHTDRFTYGLICLRQRTIGRLHKLTPELFDYTIVDVA